MFKFKKVKIIHAGENIELEKKAIRLALNSHCDIVKFYEEGTLLYDDDPYHQIQISFTTLEKYCKKHHLRYKFNENTSNGFDICTVCTF